MNPDTRVISWKSLDPEYERVKAETFDFIQGLMSHGEKSLSLRERADAISREFAPVQIASFDA
jgi:hypothetical protein